MSCVFPKMVDILPEGRSGNVQIMHVSLDQQLSEMTRLRALCNNRPREYIPPGKYCQLIVGNDLVMSDTLAERSENTEFVQKARGDVLIAGLGLGMVLQPLLNKPEVTSITVIELSQDVIKLVAKHFPTVEVICADINTWQPPDGSKWNTIFFDIWFDINADDVPEMNRLHRRFRQRLHPQGWIASWAAAERRAL